MIRLSGLIPFEDVDIVFTGVRQGEKLFEELEMTGEDLEKTRHPKIFIGKIATFATDEVEKMLSAFRRAVEASDEQRIRGLFNQMLSEASVTSGEHELSELMMEEEEKYFTQHTSFGGVAK